jgi:hypothetical protein
MAAETDAFIVATYALWAGDVAYAERLLRDYSPPHRTPTLDREQIESPEDIVRAVGALRLRQVWQKRAEFERIVDLESEQLGELTSEPQVIETKHLRGALWRRSERQFLLQAYLTHLEWAGRLLELAQEAASRANVRRQDERRSLLPEPEAERSRGASWSVEGTLFIEVDVNDLGQIEANGLWTRLDLPESSEAIITPFSNLLNDLDRPVGKSDLAREPQTPE